MNQIMKYIVYLFCTLSLLNACGLNRAYAYDTAPRITDREIVESLVELKQGQKNINQRFEDMNTNINQRFEDINQRFEDMNQRFEELHSLILTLFGSVMALIVALIGYMIWDR
ncbi:MAG: hypothetical protein U9N77_13785, partial [Thermodesulfobacteriota bacterium]|nr:hypothetical protein [Thermodesulfobacteriota bacterium]